ncbi:outer-membrane receptor for ferric coprogen and ferric-rhodotorulic acid [Janthinobacterium sp. CG_23.3]|uniref:TonB-dependent siderophore receptor n=1 Tax=Janthinobacterium sp. CG_23.3 TaxID=3349634 RepID=UPI0038D36D8E
MSRRIPLSVPPYRRSALRRRSLALALALSQSGMALAAAPEEGGGAPLTMPVVTVTGASEPGYAARRSASAAKLELTLRETPQSVSVVTRAKMDDFKLSNVSEVLLNTTGVTVEQFETDRAYFTSRGFDITNFQYDGVGLPAVFGNLNGDVDTLLYQRVDVVRGANGLMSATGNPSATVNFIRKRPSAQLMASASLTLGSWNKRRVEADVSTPLNASGSVSARAVLARQSNDSYLDRYSMDKAVAYGIVEARLAPRTLLSVGHSHQTNKPVGNLWRALPMYYSDGSPTRYPVSASTSAEWSNWRTETGATFAELSHQFDKGWSARVSLAHNTAKSNSQLFYVYGTPDRASGTGLFAYPSRYAAHVRQSLLDVSATGQFALAGRRHDLSVGASLSRSTLDDVSHYGVIGAPLSERQALGGGYPEPLFNASSDGSEVEDMRRGAYVAARFNLGDDVKLLTGVNATKAESRGTAYAANHAKSASKTTPYLGAVLDIGNNASAYASYTEIFNPQSEVDIAGKTLAPVMGSTAELGLKGELFERKLNLSGAVFQTRQSNAAEQAGVIGAKAYYRGIKAESRGVDLEMSGELAKGWQSSAGYTHLSIEDNDGAAAKTYLPRKMLRLSSTYRVPFFTPLKVGATLNWQSAIERKQEQPGVVTRQGAYAVLGLMARYEIDRKLSLALNANNVTDKRYINSLYWAASYYAAPRNASATLSWQY